MKLMKLEIFQPWNLLNHQAGKVHISIVFTFIFLNK
jgi:hypothetical protein